MPHQRSRSATQHWNACRYREIADVVAHTAKLFAQKVDLCEQKSDGSNHVSSKVAREAGVELLRGGLVDVGRTDSARGGEVNLGFFHGISEPV